MDASDYTGPSLSTSSPGPSISASSSSRLASLDVLRGVLVAAMVIVEGTAGRSYPALAHAPWHGWTLVDLVCPGFVFVLGVAVPLSRRVVSARAVVRRALLLLLIGVTLMLVPQQGLASLRVLSVLPRLAVAYLLAALVYRTVAHQSEATRVQVLIGASAVLLMAEWAVFRFAHAPGVTVGDLLPSANVGAWLDSAAFGALAAAGQSSGGWLLSLAAATALALAGAAAGLVLTSARSSVDKTAALIAAGGLIMATALAWNQRFPVNPTLWTSSFALLAVGASSVALGCAYWLVDVRTRRLVVHPFVALGTNALGAFVVVVVVAALAPPAAWFASAPVLSGDAAALAGAVVLLAVLSIAAEWLFRRRWFFRA